ncbi:hypothetical protein DM819_29790 [Pseudomonas hunanensis]|uniref:Diguanylate cyclase n=1 Tax=Pseudomonas hunanensis TaxID=1247546 RepID=A0ABD6N7Q2_9PSED|nr:hypothetical protein [Pseudomonas hunanensis]PTV51342.1 hypothetical protein DBL03_26395 [Pseudomonas putida]
MHRVACFAGKPAPTFTAHILRQVGFLARALPVGAGSPANTGNAGAMFRVACFAGKPAPTTGQQQPHGLR